MEKFKFANSIIQLTEDYAAGFISYREYLQQFEEISEQYGKPVKIGKVV